MNCIKIFIFVCCFNFLANTGYSQETKKKVYFLVDTINISKNNRIAEIKDGYYEIMYIFYCRCLPPTYKDLIFSFIVSKEKRVVVDKTPPFNYMSWKELLEITSNPYLFKKNYELYITEVLPKNKYRTNKVDLGGYSITQ
ncbi:hypothetical protein FA048_01380 [Pedobacter polaris]|uniref:Uncharacterized protein n=1 Tax=Pedobacter polaris TaxID=2571273 RepID=A0A4U1CVV7_9SPHI|nr:hypothetical protein [Pedobacter polaris]TKC12300.1 hypothetical protein FA048_01380 [Pedobacter polaris]